MSTLRTALRCTALVDYLDRGSAARHARVGRLGVYGQDRIAKAALRVVVLARHTRWDIVTANPSAMWQRCNVATMQRCKDATWQRCNDAPYNALHCRCTEPRHKPLLAWRGPRLGHAVAFAQTHAQAGQRIRADCSAALVVQANGGASAPSSGPGTSGNTCPAMPLRHTRHLLVGYARTARRCESPP